MKPVKLLALGLCAAGAAASATLHLAAQPEPYRPISTTDASYELILPPGTYQSLVIAFEGGVGSKTLKATLKAPSGEMTLLVGGGETLVVPLSTSGWTLTSQASIKLTQPATQVHVTAMTPAGPVKLESGKK